MRSNRWAIVLALLVTTIVGTRNVAAQDATPASLAGQQPLPLTGDRAAEFEAYIKTMLEKSHVPGASVAVVQDGKVVYLQGFGVRELGKADPVTPDTLMMIGSITKSMTSMMTGTLIDDGTLTWDTTVQSLLPDFALSDPALTKTLAMRDAYCMCTGLPGRELDYIFNSAGFTPEKLIASVADIPLTAPFGQMYQYTNQLYAIGGYAATTAAGGSMGSLYDDYVAALRKRVLDPIGMTRSTFALADVEASGDYSGSHAPDISGTYQPISHEDEEVYLTAVAPGAAAWSNAREMARYLQTLLAGGVAPDGTRVVSTENLEATWKPGVAGPSDPSIPPELAAMNQAYDMGWVSGNYRGQRMLNHGGGTAGFTTQLTFLPDAGVGIVVLTNGVDAEILNYAIQFRLFELLFGQEQTFDALATSALEGTAQQTAALNQQLGTVDPAVVTPLLGSYRSKVLGEVTLTLQDGKLMFDAGELRSALRSHLNESGAVDAYIPVDAPAVGRFSVALSQEGGKPVMVVTDPQSEVEYPFEASSAPATPAT